MKAMVIVPARRLGPPAGAAGAAAAHAYMRSNAHLGKLILSV
jgi:hypothetical protein